MITIKKEPIKSDSLDSGNVSDYGGPCCSSSYTTDTPNNAVHSSDLSFTGDEHSTATSIASNHPTSHEYIDISDLFSSPTSVDDKQVTCNHDNHQMDFQTTIDSFGHQERDINTPKLKLENPYERSIQHTSQAIEMAVADEIELPSPWVDVAILASKPVLPTAPVTSACVAIPTEIPSYVNLPFNLNTVATNYISATPADYSDLRSTQQNDASAAGFNNLSLDDFDLPPVSDKCSNKTATNIFASASDNFIDSLLMEPNEMDTSASEIDQETVAAQQLEADAILNDILQSIDSVQQQSKAMMAAQYQQFEPINVLPMTEVITNNVVIGTSEKATQACSQSIGSAKNAECSSVKVECDSTVSGCCKSRSTRKANQTNRTNERPPTSLNARQTRNLITSLATSPCCAIKDKNNGNDRQSSSATAPSSKCTCKSPNEGISNGCCVVICLKTLEHIRNALNSSTVNLIRCSSGGVV